MHDGDRRAGTEQRLQCITDVECERIDQGMTTVPAQLQQRQLRIESVATHELGVQADRRIRGYGVQPCLQCIAMIDPVGGGFGQ